jgi:hypothetical protein
MAHSENRRDRARASAAGDRYLAIFGAVAGAAGALVWLALSIFN